MHDPRWAPPLSDSDATDLLAGRVPSARPDLVDLADTVSRLQVTFTQEAPVPSPALASVLAGGELTGTGDLRPGAGRLRRRLSAAAAAVVAAVMGLGVAGALPAAAQDAFDRVVGAVVPLPDRAGSPERTAPAEPAEAPAPSSPTPDATATGERTDAPSGRPGSRNGGAVAAPPSPPVDPARAGDAGPRADEGSAPAPTPGRPEPPTPGGPTSGTSGSDQDDSASKDDDGATEKPEPESDDDEPSDDADEHDEVDKVDEPEDPDKADETEEGDEARESPDGDLE